MAALTSARFTQFADSFTSELAVNSLDDVRRWAQAFVLAAVREAMKEALDGPEKKAAVLAALDQVVAQLVAMMPWPLWVAWLKPVLTALLQRELRKVAESLIEAALDFQRGNV